MSGAFSKFVTAVAWGTLAGGGIFLPLTLLIGIGMMADGMIGNGLLVAVMPLLISGGGTLAGMILVGLPVTALLEHYHRESVNAYAGIGAGLGFVLPILFMLATEGFEPDALGFGIFLGLFGIFAGLAAAACWGRWRERISPHGSDEPDPQLRPRQKPEKWTH